MSTVVNHRNMETLTSTTSPAMTTTATEAAAATNVSRSWNATDQKLWDMIDNDYKTMLSTPQQPYVAAFVAAYSAILSLSLLGNLMVIIVIRTSKSMRNVTNYFLFNLAVADLLVAVVCIPLTLAELVNRCWMFGTLTCTFSTYIQGVSVGSSVLTIMFLSLDRYIAIRHPVESRRLCTPCHVMGAIIFIWIVNCLLMVPLATTKRLVKVELGFLRADPIFYCHEVWSSQTARQLFDGFLFALIFLAPGSVVAFSYLSTGFSLLKRDKSLRDQTVSSDSQKRIMAGRRRLALMLLMVAALFLLSWLPYTIYNLCLDFFVFTGDPVTSVTFAYVVLVIGHSHCAQNPILYCILNRPFKRRLAKMFGCRRTTFSLTHTGECSTKQIEECLQELAREFPGRDPLTLLSKRDSLKLMKTSKRRRLAKTFSTSSSAPETTGLFDRPTYASFTATSNPFTVGRCISEKAEHQTMFSKLLKKDKVEIVDLETKSTEATRAASNWRQENGATTTSLLLEFVNGFTTKVTLSTEQTDKCEKKKSPNTLPTTPHTFHREDRGHSGLKMQISLSEPAVTLGLSYRDS